MWVNKNHQGYSSMKRKLQYIVYYVSDSLSRFFNLLFRRKAYRNVAIGVNDDISESEKAVLLSQLKEYHRSRPLGPGLPVCRAPMASIYFGFNGDMVPCCFNRSYVYGTYPQTNPVDAISGDKRKQLLEKLNGHDFSYGCQHCRNQILAGNFEGVEARLYDRMKKTMHGPVEMIFELDNTCNLQCVMCHAGFSSSIAHAQGLPQYISPYDDSFIEKIKPLLKNLKVAKFLGGEPFLIQSYYRIWDELMQGNPECFINLQTNGTIYNDKIDALLKKGRFQIGISVDSLKKERFESIRKNANFETVMQNLEKFIKYTRKNGSFVNVSVCPMQQNWDEIPDLVEFCNSKGIYIYLNTVYTEHFDLRELSARQLFEVYNQYNSHTFSAGTYIAKRNVRFFRSFQQQVWSWYQKKQLDEEKYTVWMEQNQRRHPYTPDGLFSMIQVKLQLHPPLLALIEKAILTLPERFFLSDYQLDLVRALSETEIVDAVENLSAEEVGQMLMNFIEMGRFRPDES